jgi:hypothetical protein
VGIGTTSPSQKLNVSGGSIMTDSGGSTSSPSLMISSGALGTAGLYAPAANTLGIVVSSTERMRIDSSGNVGIGRTSSDGYRIATLGNTQLLSGYQLTYTGVAAGSITITSGGAMALGLDAATGSTERMRIDSSGNLLLNTTSPSSGGSLGNSALTLKSSGTTTVWGVGPTSSYGIFYVVNSSGTGVSLSSGNTSWAAQSDERLKDIIEPISDAVNKVSTLRAVIGKYKTDTEGTRRSFLVAQDVKAVLPEVIDTAEDEQGTLSIRYTEVIPLLVASIKELKAINDTQAETINALTARIVALESK